MEKALARDCNREKGGGERISGLRESETESMGFGEPFAGLA